MTHNNHASIEARTVTDKSEAAQGDVDMNDESMPIPAPDAAAKSDKGEEMINTVPDRDMRPEPVVEETKEQTLVESKVNK